MHNLLQSENADKIQKFMHKDEIGFIASARIIDYISVLSICRDINAKSLKNLLYEFLKEEFSFTSFDLFEDTFVFFGYERDNIKDLLECVRHKVFDYGLSEMMLPVKIFLKIGYSEFKNLENRSLSLKTALFAMHCACSSEYKGSIFSHLAVNQEIEKFRTRSLRTAYTYDAIKRGDFDLGFQPIVESKSGKVSYYESLLRISGSDIRFSIADCVKTLEQEDFIAFVDTKITQRALLELENCQNIQLGVNVSAHSILNESWSTECLDILASTPASQRLVIEITETALKTDCNMIKEFLTEAKKIGCKIAVDDFGSGYNSINHLAIFDIDFVKIDGNVINTIERNARNRFVVEILTKIANEFHLKVIAECVESFGCVRILEDMGISLMQGNYFSPVLQKKAWANV